MSDTPGRMLGLVTPGANFEAFATTMAANGFEPAALAANPALGPAFAAFAGTFGVQLLPPGW